MKFRVIFALWAMLAWSHSGSAQPTQTHTFHEPSESSEHLILAQHDAWNGEHMLAKSLYSGSLTYPSKFGLDRVADDGTVMWTYAYDLGGFTWLGHLEPVNGGDEVLAVGGVIPFNGGVEQAFAMRIDASSGVVLDQNTFTFNSLNGMVSSRFLHGDECIAIEDSGYYVTGWIGEINSKSTSKHAWVVKLTDALEVDWQRFTESVSHDTSNFYDWDMANQVLESAEGGVLVSGSLNAGPEAATPSQSALAWKLDANGNTDWIQSVEVQGSGVFPRIVGVGMVETSNHVVQLMNNLQDQAMSLRVMNPSTGAEILGEKFALQSTGGGHPRAFEMELLPSGDLLVAGYMVDYEWEKLDSLGQPSGVMVSGHVPFTWRCSIDANGMLSPNSFEIFPDDASNAGTHINNDFVCAFSPSKMPYIYYPDMVANASETDRSLVGYRNQYTASLSDISWVPASQGSMLACRQETEMTAVLPPDWSPGQEPTIETEGPTAAETSADVLETHPEWLDCGETGTPECSPFYEITWTMDCLDATFNASADFGLGIPTNASDMIFDWSTSDGGMGSGPTFNHTFPSPGTYTVDLHMACVWSPADITTLTETLDIVLSTDCFESPCELVYPSITKLEQVNCGLSPVVDLFYILADPGIETEEWCLEWYVDGVSHPGPELNVIDLEFGHHEVCMRVVCCEDPTHYVEDCEEIDVGLCPSYEGDLSFSATAVPGVSGGFCSGCYQTLDIPEDVIADLDECHALYWDFSWQPGQISAANMSICSPNIPIFNEICLVLKCEPGTGILGGGSGLGSFEVDRVCQKVSCWSLTDVVLPWEPIAMATSDPDGCEVRFSIENDDFPPLKDRVAVNGWWGGTPEMLEEPAEVPYPNLMMDFGWAIVDGMTGEPVTKAEGAAELELSALGENQIPVFVLNTTDGQKQYPFPNLIEPFDCLGSFSSCSEDVDGDGMVDVEDLLMLLSSFGNSCD